MRWMIRIWWGGSWNWLEENCFGGDLGHGTSMPDLSGKITDKTVQYSQVSKPRSMQNIYFSSKDN
jgi:hypothetical protein